MYRGPFEKLGQVLYSAAEAAAPVGMTSPKSGVDRMGAIRYY
jgi:hypothetical protein